MIRCSARCATLAVASLTAVAGLGTWSIAAARPAPAVRLESALAVSSAVDLAWRQGDETLFVVLQSGQVVPLRDGVAGPAVLDLSGSISTGSEQGLLGVVFSVDGTSAFVDYTDSGGDTVVAEYPVDPAGFFGPGRQILTVAQPYSNHNGGDLAIGPDGMLYIGLGDGGSADDPERRALQLDSLLGKILRIDPTPSGDLPYTIPADNPFVDQPGARGEIWAYGLRNPWRFSFDAQSGDLWIADVGQGAWEEVNHSPATDGLNAGKGVNYGWSAFEGTHPFNPDQPTEGATPPVYEYEHGERGCSVSGGVVAHDSTIPDLDGWYLYSDYCSGDVRGLLLDGSGGVESDESLAATRSVSAVVGGPLGEVYVLSLELGVMRVVAG